jgi:hypothetical protein
MLDAMREYDENANNATTEDSAKETTALDALSSADTFACPEPARAYADPNEGAEPTREAESSEAQNIVGFFTENPDASAQETSVQDESVQDESVQDTSLQDGPVQDAQVQENTTPEQEPHESAVADSSRTDITLHENSEVDKILSELADQHRLSEENLADKEAL